jgi:hypothetical protein
MATFPLCRTVNIVVECVWAFRSGLGMASFLKLTIGSQPADELFAYCLVPSTVATGLAAHKRGIDGACPEP